MSPDSTFTRKVGITMKDLNEEKLNISKLVRNKLSQIYPSREPVSE